jgi:NAD(P)-dependent dehydrogenase (short-subunit alcohol dehydrogenase family)
MKIAMITGPSSGIGRATALEMARRGYHIIAAGRSEERTMQVVDAIRQDGASAEFLHLDLASLESSTQAARAFIDSGRALDVLINNAGVGTVWGVTEDGFEIHFGVNHLGHFMLTHLLGAGFRPGARIVVVSSEVHRRARAIDFDKVRKRTGPFDVLAAYGVSKLANILFARRLAALQPEWRTYSLHPGMADTNIFPAMLKPFLGELTPADEAAETSVWCASSPEVADQTGRYYSDMRAREPSSAAQDDELAAELWVRSEEWCGITSDATDH